MRRFLLQMAGQSGAGKSTLARGIGAATGAVVLDKDVIKATLLDGGRFPGAYALPEEIAAPHSYGVFFAMAESVLLAGHSVVMDSPAAFTIIRSEGARMASAAEAVYFIIECLEPDLEDLQRRLDNRLRRSSQLLRVASSGYERPGAAYLTEPRLQIDTREPYADCLQRALEYIGRDPD